jgi:ribose-phosphate pyrophosphokinase
MPANERAGSFITPETFGTEFGCKMESPRGPLLIAACRAGSYLSSKVIMHYRELLGKSGRGGETAYLENVDFQFSDGETCARLAEDASGCDVFLFQGLCNPAPGPAVDQNYMAFLIAARAFREWGAQHVTAVLPYLSYARQDKPTWFRREPTTAKLMADLSIQAGIDRMVTWHPHCNQVQGFYGGVPVTSLDALAFFTDEFLRFMENDEVIAVAPDAGASKFITYFGRALSLKCAIASKYRPEPEKAVVSEVIGDFSGKKTAIVIDDLISSGGTVYELVRKLAEEKGIKEVYLGASHNLCMEQARDRLIDLHSRYNLKEVIVTDSIPQSEDFVSLPFFSVRSLSDVLTRVINRIHYNQSVSSLFHREA